MSSQEPSREFVIITTQRCYCHSIVLALEYNQFLGELPA